MSMSFDPIALIDWIGAAAPVGFVLASLGGVVGSLVASFAYRRAMKDETLTFEIKALLMERLGSEKDVRARYEKVLKHLEELEKQDSSRSVVLSRLGEYLSNHSPSDAIVKGVKQ